MENENLRNIENLLAAKASTQPLYEFPVDQLPLGLRDSLSGVAAEARVPALFSALPIAATYADRLKAKYCDGSDTPMALMSIIIGFRCGVIFHILEQTGEETDACIRFAKAVADYVLAMQMEMFGLRLDKQQQDNEAIPVYKSRNTLLFAQLPEQFTLFDASRERGDGASRETIRKMISRWTKRGLCKKLKGGDTEIWQKLTLSA